MVDQSHDKAARGGRTATRRWTDQRWLLDNVIRANGIDWDQPRSVYFNAPCGFEANPDFAAIRQNVRKFADIGPAFEAAAQRREAKARAAEAAEELVTARDNYFMAAVQWGAAQWPYDEVDEANTALNQKKRDCYTSYARLADHRIEAVAIPFAGKMIPGWLHLPPGYTGGRLPVVLSLPGLDTFKEIQVALANDRWLSRGLAVLTVDGPGQAESRIRGLLVSIENWTRVGKVLVDWLVTRPEIDPQRIGLFGNSLGSFLATLVAASEPRLRAIAVNATCLEPGFHTMFDEAAPTYKRRFMYMTGHDDEAAFDEFRKTLTWEGHAEKITQPYLCVAGEAEELSPLVHAERMLACLRGPKRYVVYQGARHAVSDAPSTALGPYPLTMVADWMVARLAGKPLASERWYVRADGSVEKTPL